MSIYSFDSTTGTPTPITNSPVTVTGSPSFALWDPNGKWMYVGGQTSKIISEYPFDTTDNNGTLSTSNQSTSTGVAPGGMVVTQ